MKVYIYCLKCPEGNIRYIGKTVNIKRRLSAHINESKKHKGRRHVLNWIYSLLSKGLKPTLEVVEECTKNNWSEREMHWISYYRERISNLCNICDGGLGGTGEKNFTEVQLKERAKVMSETMSKFTKKEKEYIWKLMQTKILLEIQELYPMFTQPMYSGIKLGRQWRGVTGLKEQPLVRKKRGYTYQRGLYIIRKNINGKRKTVFSSKDEQKVIDYLLTVNKI